MSLSGTAWQSQYDPGGAATRKHGNWLEKLKDPCPCPWPGAWQPVLTSLPGVWLGWRWKATANRILTWGLLTWGLRTQRPEANVHIPGEKLPSCQHAQRHVSLDTGKYHYESSHSAELTSANIHQGNIFSESFNIHLSIEAQAIKLRLLLQERKFFMISALYTNDLNISTPITFH